MANNSILAVSRGQRRFMITIERVGPVLKPPAALQTSKSFCEACNNHPDQVSTALHTLLKILGKGGT